MAKSCISCSARLRRLVAACLPAVGLAVAAAALKPAPAFAEDGEDGSGWRATIYAWLPTIEGTTRFPAWEEGSIEIGVDDLLDNLDFTFMGALQWHSGSWGFMTDVLYLDEGVHRSGYRDVTVGPGERPVNLEADLNLDMKSWVWTIAGTYSVTVNERGRSNVLLGARTVNVKQDLDWAINGEIGDLPLPGRSGATGVSETLWDAIVGLNGYFRFGDGRRWVIPYHLDVGTGDSDLTWQAMAGLGYQFGWGAVVFNYRYLDYDPGSGSPLTDLNFSGPMLGASFTW